MVSKGQMAFTAGALVLILGWGGATAGTLGGGAIPFGVTTLLGLAILAYVFLL